MTAIWKVWSELPRAFTPTGWEAKTAFLGPTLKFDRTYLCKETGYQQSERNLITDRESPTWPKIWWTLDQKRLRTVGEFLPTPPLHFGIGDTASLTAWTLYNRQQANFGTCHVVARAYSLEQRNTRRTYAGLWHASSSDHFMPSVRFHVIISNASTLHVLNGSISLLPCMLVTTSL